jgi:hypothetical protein
MVNEVVIISLCVVPRKKLKFAVLHFRSMNLIGNVVNSFNFSHPQKLDCVHVTRVQGRKGPNNFNAVKQLGSLNVTLFHICVALNIPLYVIKYRS